MTETDDMLDEARYIQRMWVNIRKLRGSLQKKAIKNMEKGQDVDRMLEIISVTQSMTEDDE